MNLRATFLAILVVLVIVAIFSAVGLSHLNHAPGNNMPGNSSNTNNSTLVYNGLFSVHFASQNVYAASDVNVSYPFDMTPVGNLPSQVSLRAFTPQGMTVNFQPSSLSLSISQKASSTATIVVSKNLPAGNYLVNISISAKGFSQNLTLAVQVVKFLVVTEGENFVPESITVPVGSTVVWLRLNGPLSQYDPGTHNVVFSELNVTSPDLAQYQSWSFTFNQVGIFHYYCSYHLPGMVGVVDVVTSG